MRKDRGMMKWAPYKSLDSQADFLMKMAYDKGKKPKPQLMEDEARRINDVLCSYHGQNIEVSYYENGYIHKIMGIISEISRTFMFLVVGGTRIDLRNLVGLKENI